VRIIIDPYESGAFNGAIGRVLITDKADMILFLLIKEITTVRVPQRAASAEGPLPSRRDSLTGHIGVSRPSEYKERGIALSQEGLSKGQPENPMSREELADKFRECARGSLEQREVEQLYGGV